MPCSRAAKIAVLNVTQLQKINGGRKFPGLGRSRISLCSDRKGTKQLRSYHAAYLCVSFRMCQTGLNKLLKALIIVF